MKIADPNPALCSGCFAQQPELVHVDFESAWDGPVVNPDDRIKVVIDDLYLCEDCLRVAGQFIGLIDAEDVKAQNVHLEAKVAERDRELQKLWRHVENLENTLADRPQKRGPGRPRKEPVPA